MFKKFSVKRNLVLILCIAIIVSTLPSINSNAAESLSYSNKNVLTNNQGDIKEIKVSVSFPDFTKTKVNMNNQEFDSPEF